MSEKPLADRIVVIIGGTSGLGLSAARAVLEAGARGVVVTTHDPLSAATAATALGPLAVVHVGNAMDPDHAPGAIALAMERFGAFHGLYHVAGGSGRRLGDGPLHEVSDEGVAATLALNLSSVIFSNRAAARQFLAQQSGGAIVNVGSVLGWSPSPAYFGTHVYAAAKAGLVGFTRSIAAYYAPRGIRCNMIAPGLVDTPMARRAAGDAEIQKFIAGKQPLDGGRIGKPEDCDAAVVYLLSDDSRFVTGQVLAVDGGWTVSEGQVTR